jgi:hypothetical protein
MSSIIPIRGSTIVQIVDGEVTSSQVNSTSSDGGILPPLDKAGVDPKSAPAPSPSVHASFRRAIVPSSYCYPINPEGTLFHFCVAPSLPLFTTTTTILQTRTSNDKKHPSIRGAKVHDALLQINQASGVPSTGHSYEAVTAGRDPDKKISGASNAAMGMPMTIPSHPRRRAPRTKAKLPPRAVQVARRAHVTDGKAFPMTLAPTIEAARATAAETLNAFNTAGFVGSNGPPSSSRGKDLTALLHRHIRYHYPGRVLRTRLVHHPTPTAGESGQEPAVAEHLKATNHPANPGPQSMMGVQPHRIDSNTQMKGHFSATNPLVSITPPPPIIESSGIGAVKPFSTTQAASDLDPTVGRSGSVRKTPRVFAVSLDEKRKMRIGKEPRSKRRATTVTPYADLDYRPVPSFLGLEGIDLDEMLPPSDGLDASTPPCLLDLEWTDPAAKPLPSPTDRPDREEESAKPMPLVVRISSSGRLLRTSPIRVPHPQRPREPTIAQGLEMNRSSFPSAAGGYETPAKQSTTTARMIYEMMKEPLLTGDSSAFTPLSARGTPQGGGDPAASRLLSPGSTAKVLDMFLRSPEPEPKPKQWVRVCGRALFPEPDRSTQKALAAPNNDLLLWPDDAASPVSQVVQV